VNYNEIDSEEGENEESIIKDDIANILSNKNEDLKESNRIKNQMFLFYFKYRKPGRIQLKSPKNLEIDYINDKYINQYLIAI